MRRLTSGTRRSPIAQRRRRPVTTSSGRKPPARSAAATPSDGSSLPSLTMNGGIRRAGPSSSRARKLWPSAAAASVSAWNGGSTSGRGSARRPGVKPGSRHDARVVRPLSRRRALIDGVGEHDDVAGLPDRVRERAIALVAAPLVLVDGCDSSTRVRSRRSRRRRPRPSPAPRCRKSMTKDIATRGHGQWPKIGAICGC